MNKLKMTIVMMIGIFFYGGHAWDCLRSRLEFQCEG